MYYPQQQPPPPPVLRRPEPPAGVGLVLALPALLAWLGTLVAPTLQTIYHSLQNVRGFGPSRYVGFDNYSHLLDDSTFWKAAGVSVSEAVLPCVVAVAVAPLLAAGLDAGGSVVRRIARVLVSVGLVMFSPVAYAFAQAHTNLPGSDGHWVIRPATTWTGLDWHVALASLGLVCGLVILFGLAAMGGRAEGRPVVAPVVLVAVLAGLATVAVVIQEFTFAYVNQTPNTRTVSALIYQNAFQYLRLGYAAAIATVLLVVVGVLGLVATIVAIAARLRIAVARRGTLSRPTGPGGTVASVVALLLTLGVLAVPLVPWVAAVTSSGKTTGGSYVNTWGPALLHALIAVGVAYLAALGVSGFRPLGPRSEWLLLPLGPWLFTGITPFSVQGYLNNKDLGLIDKFAGLVPPMLVSVPSLFLLALFFRGQSARWRAEPATGFFEGVVAPSLPLAGLLVGAVTLVDAQGLLWPLINSPRGDSLPEPAAIIAGLYRYGAAAGADLSVATPWLITVPALLVLVVAQFLYLDRLVLTSGEKD